MILFLQTMIYFLNWLRNSCSYYTVSDANGKYRFDGIAAGSYVVKADHPEYLPNSASVNVGVNQLVQQNIILYWKVGYDGKGGIIYSVWGTGATNAYACGTNGTLIKYDGTWKTLDSGTGDDLCDIWGAGTRLIVTGPQGFNLISTDSGATWTLTNNGCGESFYSLWGVGNGSYILAFTASGKVYSSVDGGQSWSFKSDISGQIGGSGAADIWGYGDAITNEFVIVTATGKILVSTDGGTTWLAKSKPAGFGDLALNRVWGTSDGSLILIGGNSNAGTSGGLLYSTDGGNNWTKSSYIQNYGANFCVYNICGKSDGSSILIGGTNDKSTNPNNETAFTTTKANVQSDTYTPTTFSEALKGGSWSPDGAHVLLTSDFGKVVESDDFLSTWKEKQCEISSIYDIAGWPNYEIFAGGGRGATYSASPFSTWNFITDNTVVPNSESTVLFGSTCSDYLILSCGQVIASESGVPTNWMIYGVPYYQDTQTHYGILKASSYGNLAYLRDIVAYSYNDVTYGYGQMDVILSVGTLDDTATSGTYKGIVVVTYILYDFGMWISNQMVSFTDTSYLESVWGNADASVIACVGKSGKIKTLSIHPEDGYSVYLDGEYNGGSTDELISISGKGNGSSTTLYAVGVKYPQVSTDGAGTVWTTDTNGISGNAVWLNSLNDIYVGGTNIWHYDGSVWQKMLADLSQGVITNNFKCNTLAGGFGDNKLYAGCVGGRIYNYDTSVKSLYDKERCTPALPRTLRRVVPRGTLTGNPFKGIIIKGGSCTLVKPSDGSGNLP